MPLSACSVKHAASNFAFFANFAVKKKGKNAKGARVAEERKEKMTDDG